MKFTELFKPRYTAATVCGVPLQLKTLNWSELQELQERASRLNQDQGAMLDLVGFILANFVRDEDGTPIVFADGQGVADLPVEFCLALIDTLSNAAAAGVPSAEDAKKK